MKNPATAVRENTGQKVIQSPPWETLNVLEKRSPQLEKSKQKKSQHLNKCSLKSRMVTKRNQKQKQKEKSQT